ncbi:MAG: response regulator, partial [Opitutaceae bacterium]
ETLRRLRESDPAVRVLLMSGYTQSDVASKFSGKGLAGFVHKPFDRETFTAAVREMFAGNPTS